MNEGNKMNHNNKLLILTSFIKKIITFLFLKGKIQLLIIGLLVHEGREDGANG